MTKRCCTCKETKSLDDFYKNRTSKDKHSHRCIECSKIYRKEYYQRNKDKCKKAVMDWLKANKFNYVYIIQNLETGKSYIGSSVMYPARRFAVHKNLLRKGTHHNSDLQEDWNLYGAKSFSWDVLEKVEGDVNTRLEYEQFFIEVFPKVYNQRSAIDHKPLEVSA